MRTAKSLPICLWLLTSAGLSLGAEPDNWAVLDQKKIHADYNNGDFEKVTFALESFMRRSHKWTLAESVFVAKHLAVVYSASPDTREKGKYYMHRLLELVPSAKLVDMFVSDEIDRIFEKVREEFMVRQRAFGVDSGQVSVPERRPQEKPAAGPPTGRPAEDRNPGTRKAYWIAGGAGVVAAGLLAFYFLDRPGQGPDQVYPVPK